MGCGHLIVRYGALLDGGLPCLYRSCLTLLTAALVGAAACPYADDMFPGLTCGCLRPASLHLWGGR